MEGNKTAEKLYESQSIVLMENVQVICQLMERLTVLGEETVFLSVNLMDDSSFYSGSSVGKRFMLEKSDIVDMFFQFCKKKYEHKTSLTMDDIVAAKSNSSLQNISNFELQDCIQIICEHIEKLTLIGVNSVFITVNLRNPSSICNGSPLGKNFLSEKSDISDQFIQYCEDNSLMSKNEEVKSELMNHVQAICEDIEKLSSLGEESVFLSVNMKNETSFYSGSKSGKMFLDYGSNVLDLFFQFCKAIQSGADPAKILRKNISTQTENTSFTSSCFTSTVSMSSSSVNTSASTTVSAKNTTAMSTGSASPNVSSVTTSSSAKDSSAPHSSAIKSQKTMSTRSMSSNVKAGSNKRSRDRSTDTHSSDSDWNNDGGTDDESNDSDSNKRTYKLRKKDSRNPDKESLYEKHLKMLKCNTCNKYFHKVKDLRKHEKSHKSVEVFLCSKCDISIYNKASYKIHMSLHEKDSWKKDGGNHSNTDENDSSDTESSERKQKKSKRTINDEKTISSDSKSGPTKTQYIRVSKDILESCDISLDDRTAIKSYYTDIEKDRTQGVSSIDKKSVETDSTSNRKPELLNKPQIVKVSKDVLTKCTVALAAMKYPNTHQ